MDAHQQQRIIAHLQREDVQERIRESLHRIHENVTVTISGAARMFGFSENQLRDWEEYGLLRPSRPKGQRLYTFQELDKLALIRELMTAKFAPSEIPPDIDSIWNNINGSDERQSEVARRDVQVSQDAARAINQRIEHERENLFWNYFVSHALRLSLALICEDAPNTSAGLLLPLGSGIDVSSIRRMEDLAQAGEALVGWLGASRSSHTLLTKEAFFEYATDYRLLPLAVMKDDQPQEAPADNTLIFIERRARPLTLSAPAVETIRRLLRPLYEDAERSRACFGADMRDVLLPATDLHSSLNYPDIILNGLADMVVRLGGQTAEGAARWRFCCILLPKDSLVPLYQRSLVVRARSKDAPHRIGITTVTPDSYANSPSIRALQSGHIVYLPKISQTDKSIAFRDIEEPVRSVVAIPVGGEDGLAVAVLYVASAKVAACSEEDQRVLRMLCRMVEEVLKTYAIRQQEIQKLTDIIKKPDLVDSFFEDFLSENDFTHSVETLLEDIQANIEHSNEQWLDEVVSIVAIDIDNQSSIANKYGYRAAKNLSRAIGLEIQGQLRALFPYYSGWQLYHLYSDRFCVILRGISLEEARDKAERLRQILRNSYYIDALRPTTEQVPLPDTLQLISDVTVRLGVTSYPYAKLEEILLRYPPEIAVSEVRATMVRWLNKALDDGKRKGGNIVISWNPDPNVWGFEVWPPQAQA